PSRLDHGGVLPQFQIAYETWGKLNEKRDNVILLHTGLSASSHAKSTAENSSRGWWEDFIGPGQPLDTNKFFIICTNVLGGCFGSTGPSSIDPLTSKPYATSFPILTIFDMIRAQKLLLEHLDISKLWASVGSSMGGMQSLAFTQLYPESVNRLITISSCARSHPYSIALRFVQRQILMSDPNWKKGYYYDSIPPHVGMKLARQVATISYRSGPEWEQRFGRRLAREERSKNPSSTFPSLCPEFSIETYLEHQGERWCLTYDANSLLYISKAMDLFDLSLGDSLKPRTNPFLPVESSLASTTRSHPNSQPQSCTLPPSAFDDPDPTPSPSPLTQQKNALLESQCLLNGFNYLRDTPALVLGVQSDILFPIWQQKEISEFLKKVGNSCVTYYELDAIYGHDTFLLDKVSVGSAVKGHLENIE
ncbi:Alpha/Beta hydrolase protein, partial [Paraphysoderma sedebokerense]